VYHGFLFCTSQVGTQWSEVSWSRVSLLRLWLHPRVAGASGATPVPVELTHKAEQVVSATQTLQSLAATTLIAPTARHPLRPRQRQVQHQAPRRRRRQHQPRHQPRRRLHHRHQAHLTRISLTSLLQSFKMQILMGCLCIRLRLVVGSLPLSTPGRT
jgi:hypothetical protein